MNLYKHLIVSELSWCIGSAPLMLATPKKRGYNILDESWFSQQLHAHQGWLELIDEDPSELIEACSENKLLGKRFEAMIGFWFRNSPLFKVILANHQIIDKTGTAGEIDFIVEDRESGNVLHLEIACKFYLSFNNSPSWADWCGLNGRDNLKLKMDKFEKQLSLLNTAPGLELRKTMKLEDIRPTMLLKGYFFHHIAHIQKHKSPKYSNANYPSGFWLFKSEMRTFFNGNNLWHVLPKRSWLCPYYVPIDSIDPLNDSQIQQAILGHLNEYKRGLMVVKLIRNNDVFEEVIRGCVVPNHWPNPG